MLVANSPSELESGTDSLSLSEYRFGELPHYR